MPTDDGPTTRTVHRTTRDTDELIKERVSAACRALGRRPTADEVLAAAMKLAGRYADEYHGLLNGPRPRNRRTDG